MNEKLDMTVLRAVAEAATPGPWETLGGQGPFGAHAVCHRMKQGTLVEIAYRDAHFDKTNATHIATFDPPTVLALLSRLEQAEAELANWKTTAISRGERAEQAERLIERVRAEAQMLADSLEPAGENFLSILDGEQDG